MLRFTKSLSSQQVLKLKQWSTKQKPAPPPHTHSITTTHWWGFVFPSCLPVLSAVVQRKLVPQLVSLRMITRKSVSALAVNKLKTQNLSFFMIHLSKRFLNPLTLPLKTLNKASNCRWPSAWRDKCVPYSLDGFDYEAACYLCCIVLQNPANTHISNNAPHLAWPVIDRSFILFICNRSPTLLWWLNYRHACLYLQAVIDYC